MLCTWRTAPDPYHFTFEDVCHAAEEFLTPFLELSDTAYRAAATTKLLQRAWVKIGHSHEAFQNGRFEKVFTTGVRVLSAITLAAGYILFYEATLLITSVYDIIEGVHDFAVAHLEGHSHRKYRHLMNVTVGVLKLTTLVVEAPIFEIFVLALVILQDLWSAQTGLNEKRWWKTAAYTLLPMVRVVHNLEHFQAVYSQG